MIFSEDTLETLFPAQRTNDFFEALFGDADEGAYDIKLSFQEYDEGASMLRFYLDLYERPGCCLVCSLTHGLPEVFSRHPVIDIKGLVADIEQQLDGRVRCVDWKLGTTQQRGKSLHSIPLNIFIAPA
ncbi:MAG TPA: pancreas/duodenum homeobox protein 1 [Desulfobacteraceae bacterium]|nr:pancreas/duodenum homeobox protein 1 [Desulfobacteraceae bacterium]